MSNLILSHLWQVFIAAGASLVVASLFAFLVGYLMVRNERSIRAIEREGPGELERAYRIARQSYNIISDAIDG